MNIDDAFDNWWGNDIKHNPQYLGQGSQFDVKAQARRAFKSGIKFAQKKQAKPYNPDTKDNPKQSQLPKTRAGN